MLKVAKLFGRLSYFNYYGALAEKIKAAINEKYF